MKSTLLGFLLLAATLPFQNPPVAAPAKKEAPPVSRLTPEEQIEHESLLPTVDVSKIHVEGSCYPARDNGDGTCTRVVYSLQPGVTCIPVHPTGTRTFEMNCTYKKPKAFPPHR